MGEVDDRLSSRQLGPLQRVERIVRKEDLAYERAGEEGIRTLECVQDKARAGGLGTSQFLLPNRYD